MLFKGNPIIGVLAAKVLNNLCDGWHKGTEFKSVVYKADQSKVFLYMQQTKDSHYAMALIILNIMNTFIVFDAYGTLFNANSAAKDAKIRLEIT